MKLSTKIAYNTIIQFTSKIFSTILGLLAIAIITRHFGQFGFGQYTTIITFLSIFAILADFGLTLVTVQLISQPQANENKLINNLFTLRLISALTFLGLAPLLVLFFPYDSTVKIGVALASASFLFTALNQVFVGLFQKKLRMDKVSIAEVSSRVILLISVIISIKLSWGLNGIMLAMVVANLISFIMHYFYSRAYIKLKLEFDLDIWKMIAKKSWPLAITIALNLIYLKADTLVLSLIKSSEEVGIYGATYKVIDVLVTLPFMFAGIVLPVFTLSWLEKNHDYFKHVLQKSFDIMAIIAIPSIVGVQFLANNIMILVAGPDFSISGSVLRILIIACATIFLGTIMSHAIIAIDKQKKMIKAYMFTSVTALFAYLILIPKYSYFGAAWATVYSELAIALSATYYVWKYSGFVPNFSRTIKALIASLIMGAFIYLLPKELYNTNIKLLLTLGATIIVYFSSLYLFKGITKNDIMDIINKPAK